MDSAGSVGSPLGVSVGSVDSAGSVGSPLGVSVGSAGVSVPFSAPVSALADGSCDGSVVFADASLVASAFSGSTGCGSGSAAATGAGVVSTSPANVPAIGAITIASSDRLSTYAIIFRFIGFPPRQLSLGQPVASSAPVPLFRLCTLCASTLISTCASIYSFPRSAPKLTFVNSGSVSSPGFTAPL